MLLGNQQSSVVIYTFKKTKKNNAAIYYNWIERQNILLYASVHVLQIPHALINIKNKMKAVASVIRTHIVSRSFFIKGIILIIYYWIIYVSDPLHTNKKRTFKTFVFDNFKIWSIKLFLFWNYPKLGQFWRDCNVNFRHWNQWTFFYNTPRVSFSTSILPLRYFKNFEKWENLAKKISQK